MQQTDIAQLEKRLDTQRQALGYFFHHVDRASIERAVQICLDVKGLIILTGVGKSGIIAEKIAATLTSIGTRSHYLPAADFLHGELGGVAEEDLVIILSKSGRTQELVQIIPHLKRRGCQLIAALSDQGGAVAEQVDQVVFLPVLKELCPFDLAPTTSTTVQLLFGDLLAISLMEEKEVSLERFADNHPSGTIGRKVTTRVRDLMKTGDALPLCRKEDRLMDLIVELSNKRCGCLLLVSEDHRLEGIFTDGDLRRALEQGGAQALERSLGELATSDPITLEPDLLIHRALERMQERRLVSVAPVVEGQQLIGLVRMHDLIHEERQ